MQATTNPVSASEAEEGMFPENSENESQTANVKDNNALTESIESKKCVIDSTLSERLSVEEEENKKSEEAIFENTDDIENTFEKSEKQANTLNSDQEALDKGISDELEAVSDTNDELEAVSDTNDELEAVSDTNDELQAVLDTNDELQADSEVEDSSKDISTYETESEHNIGENNISDELETVSDTNDELQAVSDTNDELQAVSDTNDELQAVSDTNDELQADSEVEDSSKDIATYETESEHDNDEINVDKTSDILETDLQKENAETKEANLITRESQEENPIGSVDEELENNDDIYLDNKANTETSQYLDESSFDTDDSHSANTGYWYDSIPAYLGITEIKSEGDLQDEEDLETEEISSENEDFFDCDTGREELDKFEEEEKRNITFDRPKIWCPDEIECWELREVESIDTIRECILTKNSKEEIEEHKLDEVHKFDPSHAVNLSNVADMNNIHEAPLLDLLRRRYKQDEIYTFTGDILISINPYKDIPLLYKLPESGKSPNIDNDAKPHLHTVAARAMSQMLNEPSKEQAIIINGESGAGKTEASKYLIRYLGAMSKRSKAAADSLVTSFDQIEEVVLGSNILLEAFGNAKTVRNDNSSRFGKYIRLIYDVSSQTNGSEVSAGVIGGNISYFLLETSRLVSRSDYERNYHVMYSLCEGTTDAEKTEFSLLSSPDQYRYLGQGTKIKTQSDDWQQIKKAIKSAGITDEEATEIFRSLSLVLTLGNIEVLERKGDATDSDLKTNISSARVPIDQHAISKCAEIMGVNAEAICRTITERVVISASRSNSITRIKLSKEQTEYSVNALAKAVYARLFDWLIGKINQTISPINSDSEANRASIGILDIYGFEILANNSLEQLMINFANERLQRQFNSRVFDAEQKRYIDEGVDWTSTKFVVDNKPCLDLIAGTPLGVLSILDEQTLLKHFNGKEMSDKQVQEQFLGKIFRAHQQNKLLVRPKISGPCFIVKHFAGKVKYDASMFSQKNNDTLHTDLLMMVSDSTNPFFRSLFAKDLEKLGQETDIAKSRSKKGRKLSTKTMAAKFTVAYRFKKQLDQLMEILESSSPHFIRCVKPNSLKFPGGFESKLVLDQLRYIGIMETVKIRRLGFPVKLSYDSFTQQYRTLVNRLSTSSISSRAEEKAVVEKVLEKNLDQDLWQLGTNCVFLKDRITEYLDAKVRETENNASDKIKSTIRRYVQQKQKEKLAATNIQALFRAAKARTAFNSKKEASIRLQTFVRNTYTKRAREKQRLRNIARKKEKAATKIQSLARAFVARRAYIPIRDEKRKENAATKLQSTFRTYLARKEYSKNRDCVSLMQQWLRRANLKRRNAAATKIQRVVRRFIAMNMLARTKKSVLRIQRFIRALKANAFLDEKMALLHSTAAEGDVDMLSNLCAEAVSENWPVAGVRWRKKNMCTLLHSAVESNQVDVCQYLLDPETAGRIIQKYTPFAVDSLNCTALHYTENDRVFKLLVNASGRKPFNQNLGLSSETVEKGFLDGNLLKRKLHSVFHVRYVHLNIETGVFVYKKKKSDRKPTVELNLREGCGAILKLSETFHNCFEIHSGQLLDVCREGRLYFKCQSQRELQKWIQAFRKAGVAFSSYLAKFAIDDCLKATEWKKMASFIGLKNKRGRTAVHNYVEQGGESSLVLWLFAMLSGESNLAVKNLLELEDKDGKTIEQLSKELEITVLLKRIKWCGKKVTPPQDMPVATTYRNTYFSMYIDHVGFQESKQTLANPILEIAVITKSKGKSSEQTNIDIVEKPCTISSIINEPKQSGDGRELYFGSIWHMQTPLEQINIGTSVVLTLKNEERVLAEVSFAIDQLSVKKGKITSGEQVFRMGAPRKGKKKGKGKVFKNVSFSSNSRSNYDLTRTLSEMSDNKRSVFGDKTYFLRGDTHFTSSSAARANTSFYVHKTNK